MPNLTSAPRAALTKARPRAPGGRRRHERHGWWMAIKVAFLLERFRRRRSKDGSSPSPRQIALVVVSAGLAILVIRVVSQRARSRGAGPHAESQPAAGEAASTPSTSDNDTGPNDTGPANDTGRNSTGLANETSFTDTVQSEMARHDDASTTATGAD